MEKRFYTKQEAADLLGLNPRTIGRYLLSGRLKGAKLGKGWKISDDDIQAFYDIEKAETEKYIMNAKKEKI